ncbi:MAG: hypothetical protein AAGC55_15965 [Myxococcota bacterium]
MNSATAMAALADSWWGYAEADPTLVGVVVAVIAATAVAYVIGRAVRGRTGRGRAAAGKALDSRG